MQEADPEAESLQPDGGGLPRKIPVRGIAPGGRKAGLPDHLGPGAPVGKYRDKIDAMYPDN